MVFDKRHVDLEKIEPLHLNGAEIDFVSHIKYLETTIKSDPDFTFTAESDLRSFYRASNSVLNVLEKPDEAVQMQLLFSNCAPTITYGCAVKEYTAREMTDCNTALNDAIRKIFSYQRWQSTRALREGFGYCSLHKIFSKAKKKFQLSLVHHSNTVLSSLYVISTIEEDDKETDM